MLALYNQILGSKELPISYLYKYNRYYQILNNLNNELMKLGFEQQNQFQTILGELYKDSYAITGDTEDFFMTSISDEAITEAINRTWTKDGLNWSDRLWLEKDKLVDSVRNCLIDAVATGSTVDDFTNKIRREFNVSFNQARRLARTELCHVEIQATLDRYKASGFTKYRYLTARDDIVCGDDEEKRRPGVIYCEDLDDQVFFIDRAVPGVNLPPIHPNCRCTITAVIE